MRETIEMLNSHFSFWDAPIKAISYRSNENEKNHKVKFKCLESGCDFDRPLADVMKNIKNNEQRPFCTVCSGRYFHEEKVRFILQQTLKTNFSKERPSWLKYEGCELPLELDGVSENGKIAFEYQGEQHFKAFGHTTESDLKTIKERDEVKVKLCREKPIKLIVINAEQYGGDISDQIEKELKRLDIPKKSNVNWEKFKLDGNKTLLAKAEMHALKMGYTLTEPKPLTENPEDFIFKCTNPKHKDIKAKQIIPNRGRPSCKQCSSEKRGQIEKDKRAKSIDDMAKVAMECKPPMKLQRWAGKDKTGARLYKCSDCGDVRGYKDQKVIKGKGVKVCISCGPHKKPRIKMYRIMEHAHMLGGECLSSSEMKLTKDTPLEFKCFNIEHLKFVLSPTQLLDSGMWCIQPPCNTRKKKKSKIRSAEIISTVGKAFPGLTIISPPADGQDSKLKLSCENCDSEVKGKMGVALTYKKLKTYGELECPRCYTYLGFGWEGKGKAEE